MKRARICFIGNSHLAAIKLGWEIVKGRYPEVDCIFFGAVKQGLEGLVLRDDTLVPASKELETKIARIAGGMTSVRLKDYDWICVVGLQFEFGLILKSSARLRTVSMPALGARSQLVSDTFLKERFGDQLAASLAARLLKMIKSSSDKVLLVPTPVPSEHLLSAEPWKHFKANDSRDIIARLYEIYLSAAKKVAASQAITLIHQPPQTFAFPGLSRAHLSRGSVRLETSIQHRESDVAHMNAEFGSEMLREIFKTIAIQPRAENLVGSAPANAAQETTRNLAAEAPQSTLASKSALVVLGMHRSGTSALSRGLSFFGFTQPTDAGRNWEPAGIRRLNEAILKQANARWHEPEPFLAALSETRKVDSILKDYLEEAKVQLQSAYGNAPRIVFKDPRLCLLWPLWETALNAAGFKTRYVLIHRNPIEVARSLKQRNEFPLEKGIRLWLQYNFSALEVHRGPGLVQVLSYEQLLAAPVETMQTLLCQLGEVNPLERRATKALETFLTSEQRHQMASAAEFDNLGEASHLVKEVHQALLEWQTISMDKKVALLNRWAAELNKIYQPATELHQLAVSRR